MLRVGAKRPDLLLGVAVGVVVVAHARGEREAADRPAILREHAHVVVDARQQRLETPAASADWAHRD